MKKFLVLLIVVGVFGTALVAIAADKGPAEIKLDQAKMGTVTFPHEAHQGLMDCTTCHHTGGFETCHSCHNGDDAPKSKDAFHASCKDCHKKEGKGPTKCKECHVK